MAPDIAIDTRVVDSVPAWTWGERARNSKFGGNIVLAGVQKVSVRLTAIKKLSETLGLQGEDELRSSAHILHEVKTANKKYMQFNSPFAVGFKALKAGIASGRFPKFVAFTAPQFGFPGAERGGMISPLEADRVMAYDLHREAIENSMELEAAGLGELIDIWWPAFTTRMFDDPDNPPMSFAKAWDLMVNFWVKLLQETGGEIWLEWKPGDPGCDYLNTLALAVKFCHQVNSLLGRVAMHINNEWAHILLAGHTITADTETTIKEGLFTGFFHGNMGQMMPISIESWLAQGHAIENYAIGIDWDWPIGVGGNKARWFDQQNALKLMENAGKPLVICEHDVNPAGLPPEVVFTRSILNRRKMSADWRAAA